LVGVFDEDEVEFVEIEVEGFVIIPDYQGNVDDGLIHAFT
jgi:hypothetical protein